MSWTDLGTSTSVTGASKFLTGGQGATLTAATTITITDGMHQVDGSATIQTINGGEPNTALLLYRPLGATWSLGSSGNIKASSATPTERIVFLSTPDGTTWYGDSQGVSVASANTDISVAESGGTYTLTFNPANVTLDEFTGPLAITKGGTGQTTATAAFDALAPTTTQGDTIYYNGTDNVRLAKGSAYATYQMNSGATAPNWTLTPLATLWGVGDATMGMYAPTGASIGWKIGGTEYLTVDASRLAPTTNLGLALGDADQFWGDAYYQDTRGWRLATLSTTPGANTIATIPVAASTGFAFIIDAACFSAGTSSNFSIRTCSFLIYGVAKSTTITVTSTAVSAGGVANSDGATYNFSSFSCAGADAGSNVLNITATTAVGTGTASSFLMRYKLTWLYGDPAVTELL